MKHARSMGAEAARKAFPRVVERASQGETTLITRHGRPTAAVVPVAAARGKRRAGDGIVALRGSGKGLYGNVRRYIERVRAEWQ